jgi:hypothetical protein
MKLEFELNENDYKNAYKEFLKNDFKKKIWFYILISLIVCFCFTGSQIDWVKSIIIFPIILASLLLAIFIPSLYNIRKNNNLIHSDPKYLAKKIIQTTETGITINTSNSEITSEYMWGSIKTIINLRNFVFLIFTDKKSIIINKATVDNTDIVNFIALQSKNKFLVPVRQFKPRSPYAIGLLGIIPNVGLVVGIILIVRGFTRKDKKFFYIGLANIAFTFIFWLALVQFLSTSSDFRKAEINSTNYVLHELVKEIEFYKIKNGYYPDSLSILKKENELLFTHEVFADFKLFGKSKEIEFYYKKIGNDYILKSYGPDRVSNTEDDIVAKRN